ncbi:MAG TPA: lysophospholipid acyltransferase family protein [Opitutaceae bacterium]|nr:lysophospholipid acyltransferase family protein [Opitutaceae bacterium]
MLWPLAFLLQLWGRSLRFELSEEDRRNIVRRDQPMAVVLWHNRLFLVAEIFRRYRSDRPIHALVSASRDGAWLHAFLSIIGIRTVRGSSHRFGREAAMALVDALRAGHDIGITPDGPRGPCYELKPGGLIVARRTQAPLLLIGGRFPSAWRLRSWDRFYLPRPFSRVQVRCEYVPAAEIAGDRDEAIARLSARLMAISPDE